MLALLIWWLLQRLEILCMYKTMVPLLVLEICLKYRRYCKSRNPASHLKHFLHILALCIHTIAFAKLLITLNTWYFLNRDMESNLKQPSCILARLIVLFHPIRYINANLNQNIITHWTWICLHYIPFIYLHAHAIWFSKSDTLKVNLAVFISR